ncbi:PREDICTED: TELO2-interacting protein 2-like [Polistes dominula]|uniref:TELO2-interacting protein 2-like n=1 Tax=Polistes dominula TaxID=743375 RepID=A0ABM1INJ7_POLDO|nr:PREDICTED: TELO2-interacting protein 2-like [Polistes dominula]
MDNLINKFEDLKIPETTMTEELWLKWIDVVENSFVPQKICGNERPLEEEDFREYRAIVDRNLNNIKMMLESVLEKCKETNKRIDCDSILGKTFGMNLLYLIGEMHEKNVWNTAESVKISKTLSSYFCQLYVYENVKDFIWLGNNIVVMFEKFRYKLQRDTWKTYPSAVAWYKWFIHHIKGFTPFKIREVLFPTILIILDDYVPENIVKGLECLHLLTNNSCPLLKKEFIETGYAEAIYYSLERLAHQRNVIYTVPLYLCLKDILEMLDMHDNINLFEWNKRDVILSILLSHMEFEQDVELRHAYMLSLPQLLSIGSTKWCDKIARILSDYCKHQTDLRTLKVTVKAVKVYIMMFNFRVVSKYVSLCKELIELRFDLMKTPIFDMEIVQNLEDCIFYFYKNPPSAGCFHNDCYKPQIQGLSYNKYLE